MTIRTVPALAAAVCILATAAVSAVADTGLAELAASVRELGLGEAGFMVGARLTPGQEIQAANKLPGETYPGTFKFSVGDLVVVAGEESRLVLALYQRRETAGAEDVRELVGHLMASFGPPTTAAHDKLIYWAWGPEGRIDEETYLTAKAAGHLDILATVKFHSAAGLDPNRLGETSESTAAYYIITSDRLLGRFVEGR